MKEKYKRDGNPNWKGNNVTYSGVHSWIKNHKPKPKFCENCKKVPPYDLANISGKYKREINDYNWLCRSCHSKEHRGNKEWGEWINGFEKTKRDFKEFKLGKIECLNCGKEVKKEGLNQKYCSIKCKTKKNYERNKFKILERSKRYHKENKEKIKEKNRKYYQKNKWRRGNGK